MNIYIGGNISSQQWIYSFGSLILKKSFCFGQKLLFGKNGHHEFKWPFFEEKLIFGGDGGIIFPLNLRGFFWPRGRKYTFVGLTWMKGLPNESHCLPHEPEPGQVREEIQKSGVLMNRRYLIWTQFIVLTVQSTFQALYKIMGRTMPHR